MKILQNTNLLSILAIALTILFLTGCGLDQDDHEETPVGLVLTINGNVLATQEDSNITYASLNHFYLNQGITLRPILVEFIAEDGDRFIPDSNDGYSLQFSAGDSNMVTIEHLSEAAWTIQITGNEAGDSTMSFELMHNGHADFQSLPFQVRIVESQQ